MTATTGRKWINPEADLYTPEEVGQLFRVDAKTVARWDAAGRFPEGVVVRTLGGHRRFRGDWIRTRLAAGAR